MARFITVTVRCDWAECPVTAEENIGEVIEKTLSIDGKQARAFLLCKEHLVHFEEIVLPLMAAGIKVETAAPNGKRSKTAASAVAAVSPTGTVTVGAGGNDSGNGHTQQLFKCQVPNCGRTLKNRTGLAQHVIRQHGFSDLAHYEDIHGEAENISTT